MKPRLTGLCLSAVLALTVCAAAGCTSGSGSDLAGSVSEIVGNVSKADQLSLKANAAELTNCCKTYYAAVYSGTLSAENPGHVTADPLPSIGASMSQRKNATLTATVKGAIQYSGSSTLYDLLHYFVADPTTCTIYAVEDDTKPASATLSVKANTTLSQLGFG